MTDGSSTRWMTTAGGVVDIVAGILGFIGSLFLAFLGVVVREAMLDGGFNRYPRLENAPAGFFWVLALLVFVLSIMALIGGILAVQRKAWGVTLAGSICAIFQSGILGIIATVFIALSKKDFTS